MALKFGKGSKTGKGKTEDGENEETPQKKSGVPSFLKTGKKAQLAQETEVKKQEAQSNQVQRFWMPAEQDTQITFLSGAVIDDVLEAPMWYEHQVYKNGNWRNWPICVSEDEPCPICNGGNESRLVAGFTIIDHSAYKSTKGKNKGKVWKDQLRILVCKQASFKLLQKLAVKRKGLVGATFDVSRSDNNASNVGDMFDYVGKRTLKELQKEYGAKDKVIKPYDFGEILCYMTAEELVAAGFSNLQDPDDSTDYSNAL